MNRKIAARIMILALVPALLFAGACGKKGKEKAASSSAIPVSSSSSIAKEESSEVIPEESSVISSSVVSSEIPEEPVSSSVVSSAIPEEEAEETREGMVRSLLTGDWIDEKYDRMRPYTVMLNNIEYAYPQSGTSEAGIIYEILAEGGITRLMGVFDDITSDRVGSCRSARHYYVDFSEEYDAIYVHFGQTIYATNEMKKMGTDDLSGLSAEGSVVFYRDYNINAPHNAFASGTGIANGMKYKGYRTELADKVGPHFNFSYKDVVVPEGEKAVQAARIDLPFSYYTKPYLTYDKNDGTYTRTAFGSVHVDRSTGEQLKFTNVFIQFVNEYNIDRNGYQTMDLLYSNGTGWYVTKEMAIPVYWKKDGGTDRTVFYYDSSFTEEVQVNVGKTYYAVFPSSNASSVTFTGE